MFSIRLGRLPDTSRWHRWPWPLCWRLATLFRLLAADRGVPAIVFALISCVVTGGIYSLQQSQDAENGIIANWFQPLARCRRASA